jgi:anaphase-promoting complex subunit 6
MREGEVEKLRAVVRDCLGKHLYSSAIFFADKLATLAGNATQDLYMQAQALYLGKQYRRALHLLRRHHLVSADLRFRYLAAKCLIGAAICLLRGRAFEALENRARALRWFKAALKADPYCYEVHLTPQENWYEATKGFWCSSISMPLSIHHLAF